MKAVGARLPRVLGLFEVGVLASASMGPAYSLASTMGFMVAAAGNAATLALGLMSAIMVCVAITFGKLSRVLPNAGSSYSWSASAFGARGGAYAAWLLLLSNYFATMATALPSATYTLELVAPSHATSPQWDAAVGTLWIAASAALLYFGLRPTAIVTTTFLLAELLVLGASSVAAFVAHPAAEHLAASSLPAPTVGLGGVFSAMVLGIWMTDGWEVSASTSEETTGSDTTPGRGGVAGLLVTTAILLFAMVAYLRIGSVAGFNANQTDAMGYVAARLGGPVWRLVIVSTVLVSCSATLWTTLLYLSRSLFAMGRDGVLPRILGALDRRGLPSNSLLVVFAGVTGFTLITGFSPTAAKILSTILNGTSVFLGLLFCISAFAALKLFGGKSAGAPLSALVIPAVGGIALLAVIAIDVAQSDAVTQAIELGGLALGVPLALLRGRVPAPG